MQKIRFQSSYLTVYLIAKILLKRLIICGFMLMVFIYVLTPKCNQKEQTSIIFEKTRLANTDFKLKNTASLENGLRNFTSNLNGNKSCIR